MEFNAQITNLVNWKYLCINRNIIKYMQKYTTVFQNLVTYIYFVSTYFVTINYIHSLLNVIKHTLGSLVNFMTNLNSTFA